MLDVSKENGRYVSKRDNGRRARAAAARTKRQQRRILYGVAGLAVLLAAVAIGLLTTGSDDKDQIANSRRLPVAAATWSADAYTGGPRLAVDKASVDEGAVAYGHEVQATFRLRNVGDEPVALGSAEVKTLEGC